MKNRLSGLAEQITAKKRALADETWKDYCEGLSDWDRYGLAQILQNQAIHLNSITEDVKTSMIGSMEKFIFPMIKYVLPNLASQDLVSVQPMDGPVSTIFYLDLVAGENKGATRKGDVLSSARTGMSEANFEFPSETVRGELLSSGGGNFSRIPVRAGSVTISFTHSVQGALTLSDNGIGGGSVVSGGVTVTLALNYVSGLYSFTVSSGTISAVSVVYDYNSEGPDFANNSIPVLDLAITSGPVISTPDKMRTRWSAETAALLKSVHGLDAEFELMEGLAQQIRFGIDNKIINQLFAVANAGSVTFDAAPPTGVPYITHQMSLTKTLQSGSNQIFKATRRGDASWIVCGVDAATIFESHPLFEAAPGNSGPGIRFAGVYANKYKVWKNPFLTGAGGSSFTSEKFLMGYKGSAMYDTGYIYAPWIPFWQTPTVVLDDMMFRKAVMSHYGTKVVNGLFYATGSIDHA